MYPFDSTGLATSNLISGEEHSITSVSAGFNNYIVPVSAPFFRTTLVVVDKLSGSILDEGIDYVVTHKFQEAIDNIALDIYGSITFTDEARTGTVVLRYQTLGGDYVNTQTQAIVDGLDILANLNSRDWDFIANVPLVFPSTPHNHTVTDIDSVNEILDEIIKMRQSMEDPFKELHLSDVVDLDTEFTIPVRDNLQAIADAINNKAASSRIPFEMATPGQTPTSLGPANDGEWKDTPLACTPLIVGTYKVDWHQASRAPDVTTEHHFEARVVINDAALDRSYSNHSAMGLDPSLTARLQIRIVGASTADLIIAGTDHSCSLTITRLGA